MKNRIILLFTIISSISIIRVFSLIKNNDYKEENNIIYGLTAPRGRILDINGKVLVDNMGVKSLIFNSYNLSNKEIISSVKKLSNLIDLDDFKVSDYNLKYYYYLNNKDEVDSLVSNEIKQKYEERKITSKELLNIKLDLINDEMLKDISKKEAYLYNLFTNGYSYQEKIIKTNLTEEEYIKLNETKIKGVRTDITWERIYPYENVLRSVFGSVSSYEQGIPLELKEEYLKKGYNLNDRVGINNLEYIYDDYLKGQKARYVINDGYLTKIDDYKRGKDIVLSIDIDMQLKIEKILEEEMILAKKEYNTKYYDKSYLIVGNPNNGEVMALVGKKINSDKTFSDYSYYNALDSYAVGSVVKGASISVGYKYNLIDEGKKVLDGCVKLFSQNPKCSWKSLGYIDDIEALRMSSNYYQYLIAIGLTGNKYRSGIKLGATNKHFDMYRDIFASYGLGVKTNIDLDKESTGVKGRMITDDLLLNYSIGQYDTYTPIQLFSYISTVASGERKRVSLLKYVLNDDGSIYYENKNEVYNDVPLEEYYINRVRQGLYEVNKTGTGYSYTNHKFSSAGKTGTAEAMLGNISVINTSYVMYAPFEEPLFSIAMVSPNIKYQNKVSSYKYPINAKVVRRVSDLVYNYLTN